MTTTGALDAHASPPETLRSTWKDFRRSSKGDLDTLEEVIDFERPLSYAARARPITSDLGADDLSKAFDGFLCEYCRMCAPSKTKRVLVPQAYELSAFPGAINNQSSVASSLIRGRPYRLRISTSLHNSGSSPEQIAAS